MLPYKSFPLGPMLLRVLMFISFIMGFTGVYIASRGETVNGYLMILSVLSVLCGAMIILKLIYMQRHPTWTVFSSVMVCGIYLPSAVISLLAVELISLLYI